MKRDLQPTIESTLRWPDDWPRTLIEHRQGWLVENNGNLSLKQL